VAEHDDELPTSVRELLRAISSLETLPVLTLVSRRRDVTWSRSRVADELGVPVAAIEDAISELHVAGLLVREGGGASRYAPPTPDLDHAATFVVELYERDPARLLAALTRAALDRVRTSAARAFSDAFLLRPPKRRS